MYFSLCISLLTLWYGIGFLYMTRKRGLDPSIVTYISPLSFKYFWVGRVLLTGAIVLSFFASPLSHFLSLLIIVFSLFHIILLALFERVATQPVMYYFGYVVSAIAAWFGLPVVSILLFTAQELLLRRWKQTRTQRYNHWVTHQSLRIHDQYKDLSKTMTPREWFFVLHFAVTENIARPKLARIAEHVYFYIKRPAVISTGIMQVAAPRPMTDRESMYLGTEIVRKAVQTMPKNITRPSEQAKWLAREYNGSTTYSAYLFATYPGVRTAWERIEPTL